MAKPRDSGWVPFMDGEPIDADDLQALTGGAADEVERVDGPTAPGTPSSSGGQRHVPPAPDDDSDLQRLEQLLGFEPVWEMIEDLAQLQNERQKRLQLYGGRRRGAKRGYELIDILLVEAATHLFDNAWDTLRNLRDPKTWKRLRKAARRHFPKNGRPNRAHRRLSKTPPTRDQMYRARRDYFSGEPLEHFRRWYRQKAVNTAKEMGLFDPKAGSWTHPDRSQRIVGDMTWMGAATQYHRDEPFHPTTGKTRRFDPHADYHHTVDGGWTEVPGRELVVLSVRTGWGNERVLLDADFMEAKGSRSRKGRNDADHAVGMLKRLVGENPKAFRRGGAKVFIYDMAMDSECFDNVLDMRIVPMAKTPRLKANKYRSGNLGPHEFTRRDDGVEDHDIKTLNGSTWVLLPDGYGQEVGVPLERKHLHWGAEGARSIAYCDVEIPNHPRVPNSLRGATTTVRLNSTPEEINQNPHTRRTKALRPIPEADPDFGMFGGREDIESTFSDLKYRTRGRLCSIREDFNRFNILAYMILRLSRSVSAYSKRTTTPAPQPRPPTGPTTQTPQPRPPTEPTTPAPQPRPPTGPTNQTPQPGSRQTGPQRRSAATSPQAVPIAA